MKVAVVVQRYGPSVNGGAELHARYIAQRLARHGEVEVLTTCATDYVTWRNELPPGVEQVDGVSVRRFRVKHERDPRVFGRRQERVFEQRHSIGDELDWLDAEGPTSPALVDHIAKHAGEYAFCLFFSYRYYHAFYGARASAERARFWCPLRSATPRLACRFFSRCSGTCAPSCTTRRRSGR